MHRVEHGNNNDNLDPEGHDSHEEYLAAFKRTLIEKLRVCIDKDLKYDPDGGKGYVCFMLFYFQCMLDC